MERIATYDDPLVLWLRPRTPGYIRSGDLERELHQFIVEVQNGCQAQTLRLQPGHYRLERTPHCPPEGNHLTLQSPRGANPELRATLDFSGCTLAFTDRKRAGPKLSDVYNVTWRGGTWLWEQAALPFTQGQVEDVAPDGQSFTFRIHGGYPADDESVAAGHRGLVFDPATRLPKTTLTGDWVPEAVDRLGPDLFRLHGHYEGLAGCDLIGLAGGGAGHCFELGCCEQLRLDGVTVHNSPCMAFLGYSGPGPVGNVLYGCTVMPSPTPLQPSGQAPLMSSCADGIHISSERAGPVIEHCRVGLNGDDAIAVHGGFNLVTEPDEGSKTIVALRLVHWCAVFFARGDTVQLYNRKSRLLGRAVVVACDPCANPCASGSKSELFHNCEDLAACEAFRVVLDRWVDGLGVDSYCQVPNRNCPNFRIISNDIFWSRARGVLIKGSFGSIINNHIQGMTLAGILASPEAWWFEAGWLEDVFIQGNTLTRCGWMTHDGADAGGGIVIQADMTLRGEHCVDCTVPSNARLAIVGNTLIEMPSQGVRLDCVDTATVAYNRFVRPFVPEPLPNPSWVRRKGGGAVLWASHCANVRFIGNVLEDPGPATNLEAPFQADLATCHGVVTDAPIAAEGQCFTKYDSKYE